MMYSLLVVPLVLGQASPQRADVVNAVAYGERVEIRAIRVIRQKDLDEVNEDELIRMEIELWFASRGKGFTPTQLVRINDLNAIEDDSGTLLSTKKRCAKLPFLRQEVLSNYGRTADGHNGPIITLVLDAPNRMATAIKAIKGKGVMYKATLTYLEFKDVSLNTGKPLDNPKLKNLKITANTHVGNGETKLSLLVPEKHAVLAEWGLVAKGEFLQASAEFNMPMDGRVLLEKRYPGQLQKACSLGIMLAEPSERKQFEFSFANVKLP
jgi:hypothetical protein